MLVFLLILFLQTNGGTGTVLPSTCILGSTFVNTSNASFNICSSTNTWSTVGGGESSIPSGSILLIDSGTCPTGFTEVIALNGKNLLGTLVANANVGTTGGADNITPAGTNATSTVTPLGSNQALTFTGTASTDVVNHVHTLATGTGTTGNFSQVVGTVDTSSGGTGGTPTQTTLGTRSVATVNGVASYTPLGTINTPAFTGSSSAVAAQAFTGTQFDNRSAFTRVIFCKKD